MLRILLSDDNAAFRQSSKEQGAALGMEIIAFDDWESSQAALEENFDSFHAVIIDGKGRLRDSSKAEDGKHLSTATNWLKEQLGKKGYIPVVIYTGFHADLEPIISLDQQILAVFDKSKNPFSEVLNFLKTQIAKSPTEKLKTMFPIPYEFGRKHFSKDNQQIILTIFQNSKSENQDFVWKKNVLDGLRRLNETLVDTIPLKYYEHEYRLRDYIEKIKNSGNVRATLGNRAVSIIDYFNNYEFQVPGPVLSIVKNIYYTASTYAAHNYEDQSGYYPSSEVIIGLIYSHFGCYHWFNSIIKGKTNYSEATQN